MTCQEVAARFGVAHITAIKWAAANGVKYTGEGRRKTYIWTEEDCRRFVERLPRGRPRKDKAKE